MWEVIFVGGILVASLCALAIAVFKKRLTMEDREACFSLGVLGIVIGAIGLIVHFISQGV